MGKTLLTPPLPEAGAAAPLVDVTGDGRPDMVIREADRLYVYPHNGSTTSNPWTSRYDTGTVGWNNASKLLLADVTGDGRPDIVSVRTDTPDPSSLWVYPHNGATGTAAGWNAPYYTGLFGWNIANWLALVDVTGDGRPDMVARLDDGGLWMYPHNGQTGTAASWTDRRLAGVAWSGATGLLVGNVTGRGRPDLVVRESTGALTVLPAGDSTGPVPAPFSAGTGWNLADVMLLADVTGTGRPDIVVRDASGNLWVYPHNGSATANPWTTRFGAGGGWNVASAMML
ncbi:FG-GAP repeat domain-containing protein [Dactylosporangium sp. NPDC000521]|uniref:FG-GAP repeat domain-containing protein n=1 Tax=Dactylosporangium sp. NPDC000521 TaxID=3363975 RepID=UPI0036AC6C1B